jgi:MBOAT, membrane-bound O-acyltransferase family
LRQLLGAFLCFVFVYVWHGLTWSIFCWTALNFIGIVVELSADRFVELPGVEQFEVGLELDYSRSLNAYSHLLSELDVTSHHF